MGNTGMYSWLHTATNFPSNSQHMHSYMHPSNLLMLKWFWHVHTKTVILDILNIISYTVESRSDTETRLSHSPNKKITSLQRIYIISWFHCTVVPFSFCFLARKIKFEGHLSLGTMIHQLLHCLVLLTLLEFLMVQTLQGQNNLHQFSYSVTSIGGRHPFRPL